MQELHDIEQKYLYLRYLQKLLPSLPESALADALTRTSAPGVEEQFLAVGRLVGAHMVRVEAQLDDMLGRADLLPVLALGSPPRVLLGSRGADVLVLTPFGTERVPRAAFGSGTCKFLVTSPQHTLAPLRGRHGVSRLIAYLATEREILRSLLVYATFVEGLSLAAPLAVQVMINTIGFGMMTQQLLVLSVLLFVCLAGAAALRILQQVLVEHLSRRFFARTVMDYSERLHFVQKGKLASPIHRFFEVAAVDKTFFILGLDLVALVLQLVTTTVLLSLYHPLLMGFTAIMVAGAWLVVRLPFSAALSRNLDESGAKYRLADLLAAQNTSELERLQGFATWEEARASGFSISLGQQVGLLVLQVGLSVALLFVGGALVISGQLTLGQLVAAELVAGTALYSLGKLGKQLPKIYDLITSFEKLGAFVDLPLDDMALPATAVGSRPLGPYRPEGVAE